MASARASAPADLGFLFTGGLHQAWHMAPVALALVRHGAAVSAYAPPEDADGLRAMLVELDPEAARGVRLVRMALPGWVRAGRKPLALLAWRGRLLRHDALVAAERTSTLLKRLPGRRPTMIHIPHGAGDRAVGFEQRIALFDRVLVSGEDNRRRMIEAGLALPEAIQAVGSVKLAALMARPAPAAPAFAEPRPAVLYNPHFDGALSSWPIARSIVEAIVADGRFNLIVAPHVRLAERIDAGERAWFDALGARGDVHVDFGSAASADMTYTRAADIYLGDVSSQVYEFLHRPQPVVFVDAHAADWRGNPDYRMWDLGEVVGSAEAVPAALARAAARHGEFRVLQAEYAAASLGSTAADVPDVAARAILAALA